ncbi:hypothetical protein IG193_08600 [Infirmifilum lucidum]|uniref:Uncharacterized protein n=1 Tax=Infirmifilum lucidum TaxID=2776706 RepID=A0A7L9FHG9_9CREN|nr:hypothetical protein [Infirmifilum lucidum]QOJ78792.1 hypothetical protein IG193_08600 [Infirmifilum lucidum]
MARRKRGWRFELRKEGGEYVLEKYVYDQETGAWRLEGVYRGADADRVALTCPKCGAAATSFAMFLGKHIYLVHGGGGVKHKWHLHKADPLWLEYVSRLRALTVEVDDKLRAAIMDAIPAVKDEEARKILEAIAKARAIKIRVRNP